MTGWTVIIPIKPWALAKARLMVPPQVREQLARAFALDTLEIVLDTPTVDHIVVVTTENEIRSIAQRCGATILSDRSMMSTNSLNDAVILGRSWTAAWRPGSPVVMLPADLPSLTSETLGQALGMLSAHQRSFVPDAAGTGTTLLASAAPALLRPSYGPQSARRHTLEGSRPVPEVDVRVRHDVDITPDLTRAGLLGLAPHTAAVLAESFVRDNRSYCRDTHASVG